LGETCNSLLILNGTYSAAGGIGASESAMLRDLTILGGNVIASASGPKAPPSGRAWRRPCRTWQSWGARYGRPPSQAPGSAPAVGPQSIT
jgi:hypothetical protein